MSDIRHYKGRTIEVLVLKDGFEFNGERYKRKINCVVVYKVERLSRSLLDFARIMAVFDRHKVAFVSVAQYFNTAT